MLKVYEHLLPLFLLKMYMVGLVETHLKLRPFPQKLRNRWLVSNRV